MEKKITKGKLAKGIWWYLAEHTGLVVTDEDELNKFYESKSKRYYCSLFYKGKSRWHKEFNKLFLFHNKLERMFSMI